LGIQQALAQLRLFTAVLRLADGVPELGLFEHAAIME